MREREKRLVSFVAQCKECSWYRAASVEPALSNVGKATEKHTLELGHEIEIEATYKAIVKL